MTTGPAWPGCHGVRLAGGAGLGTACGDPLLDASVLTAPVAAVTGPPIWELHADVEVPGGRLEVDRRLVARADGVYVMVSTSGPGVEVDVPRRRVTIEPGPDELRLQLLATLALPLLLEDTGAVTLHGSACARDGRAVVVCGESGTGKSSLLVGLVDAGWQAVSEDMCAVDLRGGQIRVWPGPPWVRRAKSECGPRGAEVRFETPDKFAWDLQPWLVRTAMPVSHVVVLSPPDGEEPVLTPLATAVALPALTPNATWLGPRDRRARHQFGPLLDLAAGAPVSRLCVPRSASWLAQAVEIISGL